MKICDKIISKIVSASEEKEYVTVAIDGRCASGKTTLAKQISDRIPCNVFHTDDFTPYTIFDLLNSITFLLPLFNLQQPV